MYGDPCRLSDIEADLEYTCVEPASTYGQYHISVLFRLLYFLLRFTTFPRSRGDSTTRDLDGGVWLFLRMLPVADVLMVVGRVLGALDVVVRRQRRLRVRAVRNVRVMRPPCHIPTR